MGKTHIESRVSSLSGPPAGAFVPFVCPSLALEIYMGHNFYSRQRDLGAAVTAGAWSSFSRSECFGGRSREDRSPSHLPIQAPCLRQAGRQALQVF